MKVHLISVTEIIFINKDSHVWLVEDELVGSKRWGTIFLQNIVKKVIMFSEIVDC